MGNCKMQNANCKLQIEEPNAWGNLLHGSLGSFGSILSNLQFAILFSTLLTGNASLVSAAVLQDGVEAPLVGRKEPFCGAVGTGRFQVSMAATPKSLQAGDPILLTIRIEAVGAWSKPPERPDLVNKPEYRRFRERFRIDNGQERPFPAEGKWEFDFRLRPKTEQVKEIPSLVILYFRPGFMPPEKGYMATTAPAIPVQVMSRARVQLSEIQGQAKLNRAPDYLYQIITGPDVLRRDKSFVLPSAWLLCFLAPAPPALSVGWYLAWRRRNPTQARMSHLRKSRAGRQALLALKTNGAMGESKDEACGVAKVLAGYLQERLDLNAVQPTPADILSHLTNKGVSSNLADRTAGVFRACDLVRFSPSRQQEISSNELCAEAAQLILALESKP